jgi:hypothetical protein
MLNKQTFLVIFLISCTLSARLFDEKNDDSCLELDKEPEKVINSSNTTRFQLKITLKNKCSSQIDLSNNFYVFIKNLKVNDSIFTGSVYSKVEPGMFNMSRNNSGLVTISMKTNGIKQNAIIVLTAEFSIMDSNGTFTYEKVYTSATKTTFNLTVTDTPAYFDVGCVLLLNNIQIAKGTYDSSTRLVTFGAPRAYKAGYELNCKGFIDNTFNSEYIIDPISKKIEIDTTDVGTINFKVDYKEKKRYVKPTNYSYTMLNDPYYRDFILEKIYDDMEKYVHIRPVFTFTRRISSSSQITPKGDRMRYKCTDMTYCPKSTKEVVKNDGTVEVTFDFKN